MLYGGDVYVCMSSFRHKDIGKVLNFKRDVRGQIILRLNYFHLIKNIICRDNFENCGECPIFK